MKKSYFIFLAAALSLTTACSKKESTPPAPTITELTATVNMAQQVPTLATTSTATGTFTGSYNGGTKQLTYTVTYQGTAPTSAHIHLGAPGATGAVAVPFATLTSPITGTVTLPDDQATALLNNGMYVNIHSAQFPAGEIRGDIKKK